MAYQSDESGDFQIYVRPLPNVVEGDQVQVSNAGGTYPLWSRDGSELFYLQPAAAGAELVSVAVRSGGAGSAFTFGERNVVLDWPYFGNGAGRTYDVSPDGQRFLAIRVGDAADGDPSVDITVVLNWFTELKERMGTP
jgi:eukaryotic-like serine/threonine-protein kinase